MKLHFNIPSGLVKEVDKELAQSHELYLRGDLSNSWQHLERAHILGQSSPYQHTRVHWYMLRFGFRIKNTKEIIGQIPRLLVGGVKSFVGKIPVGNTGGANVPPLQAMEIPKDIEVVLNKYRDENIL